MNNSLRRSWNRCIALVGLCTLAGTCTVLAAGTVEPTATLRASTILPPNVVNGPNHRVFEAVDNDGYLNIYTVGSRFGEARAVSTAQLHKRIAEFNAMARMEQLKGSDEFRKGIKDKAGEVVRGAQGLVSDPVGSVSGAVSGVGAMFGRAKEGLMGGARSDAEDSRMQEMMGFSRSKREYAYELGIDVYSRNPILQTRLNDLARAGYAGKMTVGVLLMAVPGAAGTAVSVTGSSQRLNEVFRDQPPNELRKRNRQKLAAMGVSDDLADLFIQNAVFTPREQTLIVEALAKMGGVQDRGAFIKFAVLTENADIAFFRYRQAQMYAGYHGKVGKLARFVPLGQVTAAVNHNGVLIFSAPLDHLYWTEDLAAYVEWLDFRISALPGVKTKQLWLGGTLTPLAKTSFESLGWKVMENAGLAGG